MTGNSEKLERNSGAENLMYLTFLSWHKLLLDCTFLGKVIGQSSKPDTCKSTRHCCCLQMISAAMLIDDEVDWGKRKRKYWD